MGSAVLAVSETAGSYAPGALSFERSEEESFNKVIVLLPCFNEERDLPQLLARLEKSFRATAFDYEVLIVDDGSTDRTTEIALKAAATMPVRLIQHRTNLGLGAALKTGFNALENFDGIVITMDADNSHDPALIPEMIARLSAGCDVVIASRFQPGAEVFGLKTYRKLLSCLASSVSRKVFAYANVRDYSSGFRAYRASTLRQAAETYGDEMISEKGFACMLELLLKLRDVNAKAAEVPMTLHYDYKLGASKMRVLRTAARYIALICRHCLASSTVGVSRQLLEPTQRGDGQAAAGI